MLKKTVKFTDFSGKERTQDLYFHLSQVELTKFAMKLPDTVKSKAIANPDASEEEIAMAVVTKLGDQGTYEFIEDLVLTSYGIRDEEDDSYFEKSEAIRNRFKNSIAFDTMMVELMSDDNAASDFVNKVIPAEIANKLASKMAGKKTSGSKKVTPIDAAN